MSQWAGTCQDMLLLVLYRLSIPSLNYIALYEGNSKVFKIMLVVVNVEETNATVYCRFREFANKYPTIQ